MAHVTRTAPYPFRDLDGGNVKRHSLVGLFAMLIGSLVLGQDKPGHDDVKHVVVRPATVKWGPAPPSLPPGAQMAVLVGDPSKPGPYVARAKFPDGYRV